ncbi:cupin domain-containing protein [Listeria welshimeri]|uniref:Cupin type-2 domain-containing protein n=1 Tax=Listeria welshimeri serovar 6b (strain ATCC 35897 / DSM 20650 / CCUG 15529 / CIP 8149 / NCTC 11857 / SLCC 5334 / V8) TaxID=386043 RepID=A0AM68_LISW6|nr:cupin domain-containing protein [Listeria welshimeri]MBC1248982.1 cupin domain-containing protein [Listeria welshimeri]MBC1252593.1 cupin domain-containing protein [Listeria welshimeri]MBC1283634.1 cupin domain-containing protein [Listeria welshimeri]MBC1340758.1 cupin domain-containing protein [Listeria welshimeri]MBC1346804.1 cupin domain-containing protein [Listeria welshimeri]
MTTLENSVIFDKGELITNDYFIGNAYLKMLVPEDTVYNCPIGNVTFEPGARNNWHIHDGGQILLVTGGTGYYQEEGQPAKLLKEGDVVTIPKDVKHWHGATKDSWFVHLAISTNVELGGTTWLEPVSDEHYDKL